MKKKSSPPTLRDQAEEKLGPRQTGPLPNASFMNCKCIKLN